MARFQAASRCASWLRGKSSLYCIAMHPAPLTAQGGIQPPAHRMRCARVQALAAVLRAHRHT
ncbi:MAG TPA: hypothetical protein VGO35_06010 [Gammaproteobacteria bacterium]|nr:hypothetical protein [Gammaproteobacteria bacterium]